MIHLPAAIRKIKVSHQLVAILLVTFFLVITFTFHLVSQFSYFSVQGSQLTQNLKRTFLLNQQIHQGAESQIYLLRHQFEEPDVQFNEKFSRINFQLGDEIMQYLKLDLGDQERFTVERIRLSQSELSVRSVQVNELLSKGQRQEALHRIRDVEGLEQALAVEFTHLNELQVQKLEVRLSHLNETIQSALMALCGFVAAFSLILIAFALLMKRRILQPLAAIQEAATQIRRGDFTARAPESRPDEIGALAQGFNFMAESLAESYAGLERKVEERTKQLKELQLQFIQTAKMSAMGQLVGGVAHELNNPLTVILGFTELEKMKLTAAGADPQRIKLMEDIHSQAERCRRIVANLLQVARRQESRIEPIRINSVIDQVLQLREYELKTKNIRLLRDYDSTHPTIQADPDKIQQVILNILNNAMDAIQETGHGGEIMIRTRMQGDHIRLEFCDNGAGIREPEKIFDPFYTTKEVGKGTGLGLSVCYGIVQEHGGRIQAENRDRGACFIVTLPVGKIQGFNKNHTAAYTPAAGEPTTERVVLIVDDEDSVVDLQKAFLSNEGIRPVGVKSGEEAIRYLQEHSVQLIISDVRMPGAVDGVQLYQWVLDHRPELATRFLFISGDVVGLSDTKISYFPEVPHIQKPFQLADYSRMIHQLLKD